MTERQPQSRDHNTFKFDPAHPRALLFAVSVLFFLRSF